jgi:hypothetical protein
MVIVGSARHDENFCYSDGRAGDQIGSEVETHEWYLHSKGWRVFRCKDERRASFIADCMLYACDNPHIGYDQGENYTLWDIVKKYNFDCRLVDTNCETDCARLVRVCLAYAGIFLPDFYTGSEPYELEKCGMFDEIPAAEKNPSLLKRGDILVTKTKGHTVIVVSTDNDHDDFDGVYVEV